MTKVQSIFSHNGRVYLPQGFDAKILFDLGSRNHVPIDKVDDVISVINLIEAHQNYHTFQGKFTEYKWKGRSNKIDKSQPFSLSFQPCILHLHSLRYAIISLGINFPCIMGTLRYFPKSLVTFCFTLAHNSASHNSERLRFRTGGEGEGGQNRHSEVNACKIRKQNDIICKTNVRRAPF